MVQGKNIPGRDIRSAKSPCPPISAPPPWCSRVLPLALWRCTALITWSQNPGPCPLVHALHLGYQRVIGHLHQWV